MVASYQSETLTVSMGGRQGEGIEEMLGEVSGKLEGSRVCAGGSGGSGEFGVWSVGSRIFATMQVVTSGRKR